MLTKTFGSPDELATFVNANAVLQTDIVAITVGTYGTFTLFYFVAP